MKKWMTVLLSLVMICACCLSAHAENGPVTEDLPVAGLQFTYPRAFTDAKGMTGTDGALQLTGSCYLSYWYYIAASQEEFETLMVENPDGLRGRISLMFFVFSVGEGKSFADVCASVSSLTGLELTADNAAEIGQADAWKFYLYMNPDPDFGRSLAPEYAAEYTALTAMQDEIASAFAFSVPFNEFGEMDGKVLRFTVTDLEGNPVSSEEIFAEHAVTMVNIWATWCGPCVSELGELQAIHTRFLEKDCAVLGLLVDDNAEEAARLIAENGITYRVVFAPDSFSSIFPYEAVPTSFFVDRSGAFLGTKIVGAAPDMYETALEPLLEQAGRTEPET